MTASNGRRRLARTETESPLGPLTLIASGGALTGLYMNGRTPASADEAGAAEGADAAVLDEAVRQLSEYFGGQRPALRLVWDALLGIGYGQTVSYGQLADQIGQPTAARAVGLANGRNPVSIIVPCHRVVGADGSLTGYGGGLDNKQRLLELEQRVSRGAAR
jgi:methylated-DNA-[protein]-cysteine S-methyltransferase